MTTTPHGAPGIQFDESRWPLVVITFRGGVRDDEFDAYLDRMGKVIARREKVATVLDARRAGATPPLQRGKQAAWQKERSEVLRRYVVGTAFAIESPIVRGALTAILWVSPLPQPYHVASGLDDAERWAIEKLRAAGVTVPRSSRLEATG